MVESQLLSIHQTEHTICTRHEIRGEGGGGGVSNDAVSQAYTYYYVYVMMSAGWRQHFTSSHNDWISRKMAINFWGYVNHVKSAAHS